MNTLGPTLRNKVTAATFPAPSNEFQSITRLLFGFAGLPAPSDGGARETLPLSPYSHTLFAMAQALRPGPIKSNRTRTKRYAGC